MALRILLPLLVIAAIYVGWRVARAKDAVVRKRLKWVLGVVAGGVLVWFVVRAGLALPAGGIALLLGVLRLLPELAGALRRARSQPGYPGSPSGSEGPRPSARMTREEALRVLGVPPDATREQILAKYRELIKHVHPDRGGSVYLAAQLNQAKDVLLP